jgi:hypothetical protein
VATPHRYYRRRKQQRYPRKNSLFETASIAAGIPPAALLVGANPAPLIERRIDNMRKRNTTIAIRCTEEESRRIHELAKRHGLRLNDFVMRCALGKKIIVATGIDEIVKPEKDSLWAQTDSPHTV